MDLPPDSTPFPTPEGMIDEIRTLDLGRLEERVAVFRRIPPAPDGGPGARLADCDELITDLRNHLQRYRRRLILTEPTTLRRFLGVLADAAETDISAYPASNLALTLLKAETLILIGEPEAALAIVRPMAENLHNVEGGFGDIGGVYLLDATARLALGDVQNLGKVVFGRFLQVVHWRPWSAGNLFVLWHPALGVRPLWRQGLGIVEFIVLMCARSRLAVRGGAWWRYDRMALRIMVGGIANLTATLAMFLFRPRRPVQQLQLGTLPMSGVGRRDVLVSRVVDNVGDMVMLLPGLTALSRKLKRPVWLATRPEFAPLFQDNPHVRLLDASLPIGVSAFQRWHNLSFCPADGYEQLVRPVLRMGRAQIFARAMGIGKFRLRRSGFVPQVRLSPTQQALRDKVRSGAPLVVGVNAVGRDSSRAAPWLARIASLAPTARILQFDTRLTSTRTAQHDRYFPFGHMPLEDAIATVAACDYLVAIDDWVLHLGAALGIPTLGIAGPTMTRRLLRHHPRLQLLAPPEWLPCRPCWRSASQPCVLTGLRRSACLAPAAHKGAPAALERLMAAYPISNAPVSATTEGDDSVGDVVAPDPRSQAKVVLPEDTAIDPVTRAVREALRYADLEAITEKLEALRRIPMSMSGYPAIRPNDCRTIMKGLDAFLGNNRGLLEAGSRDLGERFLKLADQLEGCGIRAYPNEVLQLDLIRAKALIVLGREEEALEILGPMAARPYIVEGDMSSLAGILELETQVRLSLGRLQEVQRGAFPRILLIVRLEPWQFVRRFNDLANGLAIGRRLANGPNPVEALLRLAAWIRLRALMLAWHKSKGQRLWRNKLRYSVARAAEFIVVPPARILLLLISLNRRTDLLPDPSGDSYVSRSAFSPRSMLRQLRNLAWDTRPVLVTRAMGGLGDIMTMTPGMAALARKTKQPVHFATRRAFFGALQNNPSIKLMDIEQTVNPRHYRRWVNLSFCPAAVYEAAVWPRVRKGRVQLYARSMGIRRSGLRGVGWLPRCYLSPEQEAVRDAARARFHAAELPVIAVAAYARELYRSYPAMVDTMRSLADEAVLVMFHAYKVPMPDHPNIIPMMGGSLADSVATLAACDYYLGVDSAFFHIAVAFGLPCLGMFGPTSGMVRTSGRRYPKVRLMPHAQHFTCAPCWRNEDMACYVSTGQASTCLTSTKPEALADEMRHVMRMYPLQRVMAPQPVMIAAQ